MNTNLQFVNCYSSRSDAVTIGSCTETIAIHPSFPLISNTMVSNNAVIGDGSDYYTRFDKYLKK